MGRCGSECEKSHHPLLFEENINSITDEGESPFIKASSRRWGKDLTLKAAILAAVLLFVAFVISYDPFLAPLSNLLLVVVFFIAGTPSLIDAIDDILSLKINIDVLMTLAAFLSVLIGSGMEGALLLVLFSLGGSIEHSVTGRARGALKHLTELSPTKAVVLMDGGKTVDRAVADVKVGATILVKAGEVVPLDGKVVKGSSSVNLVHLTGENLPVTKTEGDEVAAGARNMEGALVIEVTHTSADSTLSKIVQLIVQAQEARPKFQRWLDRISGTYAKSIIGLSALFAVTFPLFLDLSYFGPDGSVYRSLSFLIAASPCALIIAIPVAYLSAISVCAGQGILLKGGVILDAVASCKAMAFDKTGTLTKGELFCKEVEPLDGQYAGDVPFALSVAKSLEQNAVHPLASAILRYTEEQGVQALDVQGFKSVPGYGLEGSVHEGEAPISVAVGSPDFICQKVDAHVKEDLGKRVKEIKERGELLCVVLVGEKVFIMHFQDTVRQGMRDTLHDLQRREKMDLLMLTGDHEASARFIADELELNEYHADLKPEDKLEHVDRLAKKKGLIMVGDGVNDAPALARATVGVAMGKGGSMTSAEVSDVILLHDDIEKMAWLYRKAKATQGIVRQNIFIAFSAIIGASLAALGGVIPLWLAVVLHEGGTVLVGLNSLRLLRK